MNKIVLVERYSPSSFFWPNLIKDNQLTELSIEKILSKYQGFEGELINLFYTTTNILDLNPIKEKYLKNKDPKIFFLLYVISGDSKTIPLLKEQAVRVGYDVGVCEEEKTIYSSIFNEVIFGHLNELVSWKNSLNENLLFSDKTIAEQYVELHNELSRQGKGVEDYEKMIVYEIWKL